MPTKKTTKKRPSTKSKRSSLYVRKVSPKKRTTTRKVTLQLGRKTKFELVIKRSSTVAKKTKNVKKAKTTSRLKNITTSIALIVFGLFGSFYFGLKVFAAPSLQPPIATHQAPLDVKTTKNTMPASDAERLIIPAIDLNTKVELVGKNDDGTLEVPKDYHSAGQYRYAPTPGEIGPAVITGHVDNYKGPAVFWSLRQLKPGDNITVIRADGSKPMFKVTTVKDFPQNKFPTSEVYGNIDHAGLRLITCGGSFDYLKQRYSNNTVVFAKLVR